MLNGPVSLFHSSQRYGVRLANFLPALVQAKKWSLWAKVEHYGEEKTFYLDEKNGLKSHYFQRPVFDSKVEENFYAKFSRAKTKWQIKREDEVMDLKGTVLIPDFTLTYAKGIRVHLEIVGYWTPRYLEDKINKIKKANRQDLLIAVSSYLNCTRDDFQGDVIFYKNALPVKPVLEILKKYTV